LLERPEPDMQDWGVTLEDTSLVRELELDYLRVYQQLP